MTRREWSLAKIAAVQLGLPDLSNQDAARRVLALDQLDKWNSALHPRWPAHSTEGHGGTFRPRDGGDDVDLVPVAEPFGSTSANDLTPTEAIQVHFHHWHDQALTKQYKAQGYGRAIGEKRSHTSGHKKAKSASSYVRCSAPRSVG